MRASVFAVLASLALFSVGCHRNLCANGGCGGGCTSCGHAQYGFEDQYAFEGEGDGRFGHEHLQHGHRQHGLGHHGRGPTHVAHLPHHYFQQQMYGASGPPSPTVAYPYYTTRAPRDFLMANPPSIGP